MRIVLEIEVSGEYTEQQLKDFIEFELQGGMLDEDNPFIREENSSEITRVDTY